MNRLLAIATFGQAHPRGKPPEPAPPQVARVVDPKEMFKWPK